MQYQLAMSGTLYEAGVALRALPCRYLAPPRSQGGRHDRAGMRYAAACLVTGMMPTKLAKVPRETVILTVEVHPSSVPLIGELVDAGVITAAMPIVGGR